MTDGAPVEARGLVKRYGDIVAVDHVDLTVEPGDVYGFLGPNGAGKTTTLRMLLGLIRPSEGAVKLFGRDPLVDGARALDGVAGFVEGPRFYPYLSGRKNLELLANYDRMGTQRSDIDRVLDLVELRDRAKDRVGGYSHGMRQRLGIAASLLRKPKLLLLDEPATGLDPAGMRDMRALVRTLADQGMTVLLSSHLMSEVEELCNRVAIIAHGVIIKESQLADLLAAAGGHYELEVEDAEHALTILRAQGITDVTKTGRVLSFTADRDDVARISIALGRAGVGIYSLNSASPSLERLFLSMTEGRPVDPPAAPAFAAVEEVA
ncbi:MAG: type transport system ATP-binding protein [Gaiellaceae bacterium]|nr:type transport system ATP-binding protein [Gaiellaceae bacterium]